MRKKKPKTYPLVRVDPEAFAYLGPGLTREFKSLKGTAYLLTKPNPAGLVYVSTSPTGRMGVGAFIDKKYVLEPQWFDTDFDKN